MCLFGKSKNEKVKGYEVITLKEALKLPKEEIEAFRSDLKKEIEAKKALGAYVEQLTGKSVSEYGAGIPIAIKDNIVFFMLFKLFPTQKYKNNLY